MGMDHELASMYGTPGGATQEDQTKVAEAQLFAKLAAENNIDLRRLNDAQIEQLWNEVFPTQQKVAEEEKCSACKEAMADCKCPPKEAAQDKVAAAAAAEFQRNREWQEKVAECDKLGRIMAHAYVQELGLIDQAMRKQAEEGGGMPPQFAAAAEAKKEEGGGEEKKDEEKKDEAKSEEDKKEASAIDQLAAKRAVELAKEAGIDVKVAAKRVDAVLTLGGPGQSEKIAAARSLEETIHIRALEFLEKAGYQVNWSK